MFYSQPMWAEFSHGTFCTAAVGMWEATGGQHRVLYMLRHVDFQRWFVAPHNGHKTVPGRFIFA